MARIGGRTVRGEVRALEREEEGLDRREIGVDPWRNGVERVRDLNWDKGSWRIAEVADILRALGGVWIRQKVQVFLTRSRRAEQSSSSTSIDRA